MTFFWTQRIRMMTTIVKIIEIYFLWKHRIARNTCYPVLFFSFFMCVFAEDAPSHDCVPYDQERLLAKDHLLNNSSFN